MMEPSRPLEQIHDKTERSSSSMEVKPDVWTSVKVTAKSATNI